MHSTLQNKYVVSNNLLAELIPVDLNDRLISQSISINTLGKHLLKAAGDGDVEEIKSLMTKGAPFTADWLGTSPLHLAALNNHLEVCEILLRAGICKDSKTKVDRTPLHMAAYEGHIYVVECLLKNNADYDCRDLLGMTPLHWAVQNGHAEVVAMLITYGATINVVNKFSLSPLDIAYQTGRNDIAELIRIGRRDAIIATEHLKVEMSGNENSNDTDSMSLKIESIRNDNLISNSPIDAVQLDDEENENLVENTFKAVKSKNIARNLETTEDEEYIQNQNNSPFNESLKLLQQHGITMLPTDDSNILSSVMETGHSVVLTDVGKEVLNSVKPLENIDINPVYRNNSLDLAKKKKKIITLTQEEFLAMANGNNKNFNDNVILKHITGKFVQSAQTIQKPSVKRIVMKKNKIIPISPTINHTIKLPRQETITDIESILKQLAEARKLAEEYKQKFIKKEAEAEHYKQQLKQLMEQK